MYHFHPTEARKTLLPLTMSSRKHLLTNAQVQVHQISLKKADVGVVSVLTIQLYFLFALNAIFNSILALINIPFVPLRTNLVLANDCRQVLPQALAQMHLCARA